MRIEPRGAETPMGPGQAIVERNVGGTRHCLDGGIYRGERRRIWTVQIEQDLLRTAREVDRDFILRHGDRGLDGQRVFVNAVVIDGILADVDAVGHVRKGRAHPALRVVEMSIHDRRYGVRAIARTKLTDTSGADGIGGKLCVEVSDRQFRDADVGRNQSFQRSPVPVMRHVVARRRDDESFLVYVRGIRVHARRAAAEVKVVGDAAAEPDQGFFE